MAKRTSLIGAGSKLIGGLANAFSGGGMSSLASNAGDFAVGG